MTGTLAAALQQRGTFTLAREGRAVEGLGGVTRLIVVPVLLAGTAILLTGYVWALPLGHWLTRQNVNRRQVLGAAIVVVGLALFIGVGDPDQGVNKRPRATS